MSNSKINSGRPYAAALSSLNLTMDNAKADDHEKRLLELVNASLIAESLELRELEKQEETINDVMGDVIRGIQRCIEFKPLESTLSSYDNNSNNNNNSIVNESTQHDNLLPNENDIMRESNKNLMKYLHWRKNSIENLILSNKINNHTNASTDRGTSTMKTSSTEEAARALECLSSCFLNIDQMLQLRFQMRGAAHFEMLRHTIGKDDYVDEKEKIENVGEVSSDTRTTGQTDEMDDVMTPIAIYEVMKYTTTRKFMISNL